MSGILITPAELRGFIPDTAESDATLQMRIDDNEAEINRRFGSITLTGQSVAAVTETVRARGQSLLPLTQEPASITTVTNIVDDVSAVLVADTDYRQRGSYLERVYGTWGDRTTVVYVPIDARGARRRVLIKLIQLDMNYQPGIGSQSGGPWAEQYTGQWPYADQREAILASLGPEQELFA